MSTETSVTAPGVSAPLNLVAGALKALARTSFAYLLLACCLGLATPPGVAAAGLGIANLRHDPWYREWQLWLLLAVALLLRLGA